MTELEAKLREFEGIDIAAITATATELAALKTKFADVDPDEYQTLKARPDLTARVAELETRLASEKAKTTTVQQSADAAVFRSKVSDAFLSDGGRPEALDFMITKAKETFTVKDGALTTTEFSTARPGEALSLAEWVGARIHDSAFAFRPSSGGGAIGNTNHNAGGKPVISRDPVAFGQNIEKIAKGEVIVQ